MARGSVRCVSKPGLLSPQRKRRRSPTNAPVKERSVCMNLSPSNERLGYDDRETGFDAGLYDVSHTGNQRGEGDVTVIERPGGLPWQGRFDDYGGVSAGQFGP